MSADIYHTNADNTHKYLFGRPSCVSMCFQGFVYNYVYTMCLDLLYGSVSTESRNNR